MGDTAFIGRLNSAITLRCFNDVGLSVEEDAYALPKASAEMSGRVTSAGYSGVVYAPEMPPSTMNAVALT